MAQNTSCPISTEKKSAARRTNDTAERKRLQGLFRAKAKADREAYFNRLADEAEEGIQQRFETCIQSHQASAKAYWHTEECSSHTEGWSSMFFLAGSTTAVV